MKDNRTVALSSADRLNGTFHPLSSLELAENTARTVYIKGLEFPVPVTKRIFMNADNSEGILYLATSDLEQDGMKIAKICQKRWKMEEYHKIIKVYVELPEEGSPTIRPTKALDIGNGLYRILPASDYDPEDEVWEFLPDSVVKVEKRIGYNGEYLHAMKA